MPAASKNWSVWVVVAVCGLLCSSSVVTAFTSPQFAAGQVVETEDNTVAAGESEELPLLADPAPAALVEPAEPAELQQVQGPDVAPSSERTSKIHLSEDELLVGKIGVLATSSGEFVSVSEVEVHALKNGRTVTSSKPGPDGVFQLRVEPGVYTLVATGIDGFSSYRIQVLPPLEDGEKADDDDGNPLQIETAAVPPADFGLLKMLAGARISTASLEPEQFDRMIKLASFQSKNGATPNNSVKVYRVMKNEDGTVSGVARSMDDNGASTPAADVDVFFAQDGRLVAQSVTNSDGVFSVALDSGVYTVIGASPKGFAAFSVNVVNYDGSKTALLDAGDGTQFVQVVSIGELSFDLSSATDLQAILNYINNLPGGAEALAQAGITPQPGGGFGSSGGAGGGAGGGGGLLAALVGGGIAAGIAAAINDDNDNNVQSP